MSVRYRVEHDTRYAHDGMASTSQHVACLKPRSTTRQRLLWHTLDITPLPSAVRDRTDYFGNTLSQFAVLSPHTELRVMSRSEVDIDKRSEPVGTGQESGVGAVRDQLLYRAGAPFQAAAEFSFASPHAAVGPEVEAFARTAFTAGRPFVAAAIELMQHIHEAFVFDPSATSVATPVTEVLEEKRGVCQDFAHLQIAALRALGLPARYVSGYLLTDPPAGQPRLIGADASHAWLSVWCPVLGWVDLDPTNGVVPSVRHITLAWGRDYSDVSPLRGVVLGGQEHHLHVGVSVFPMEVKM